MRDSIKRAINSASKGSQMKIVLTGGPAAGKTSIVDIIHRSDLMQTIVVQEAASILYLGGFPRSVEHKPLMCQQRAIFYVQRELEELATIEDKGRTVVCDRGSLDGLAYWPETEETFFEAIGSTMELEIARYSWVIHLDTASAEDYRTSEIRREGNHEAMVMNDRVKDAWRMHPRRLIIPNSIDFLWKIDRSLSTIKMILEERSVDDIREKLRREVTPRKKERSYLATLLAIK